MTGDTYGRRPKSTDCNVAVGGVVFGAGWGVSGICLGAAHAGSGFGNVTILWALAEMFFGAYLQAVWRSRGSERDGTPTTTSD